MNHGEPRPRPYDFGGPDVVSGELPRFVELLRMSHGPIGATFVHCEKVVDIEELEELEGEDQFDPSKPLRAIFTCKICGRFFWGWWD